jgi:hypothetical protein
MRPFTRTVPSPDTPLNERRSPAQFSPIQWTWAVLALAVLIVLAVIASPNLLDIYNSQKDFVVGSMFALVGFLFGKAFSRTYEQKALEFIRDRATSPVAAAVSEEITRTLHARGVFEELSVLERNIDAASGRLLEYFDSQAARLDFYRDSSPLTVALDELDHAAANVLRLRCRLEGKQSELPAHLADEVGPALASIHRDIHESNRRRIELYELLKFRTESDISDGSWAIFGVVTSDVLKAERTLALLRSGRTDNSPEESASQVIGFLAAAFSRAEEFRESTATDGVAMPEIFHVMSTDISKALKGMGDLRGSFRVLSRTR